MNKNPFDKSDIIKNIKLVVTDVDGVLTDGSLYYTSEGLVMKVFNVKDGMGARLLKQKGLYTAIISTDTSELMRIRGERVGYDFVKLGRWDKDKALIEICNELNITPLESAFIGDDVNDLGIIELCGFSAAPADAVNKVKESVDIVCTNAGGKGVFREFAEIILSAKE